MLPLSAKGVVDVVCPISSKSKSLLCLRIELSPGFEYKGRSVETGTHLNVILQVRTIDESAGARTHHLRSAFSSRRHFLS